MITYDKLFALLKERNLNKAYLRKNGINADTVDHMIHNKEIKMRTINNLCNLLDCQPSDILEYRKDKCEN